MRIQVERDGEAEAVEIEGAYIAMRSGGGTVVDLEDFERVRHQKWWLNRNYITEHRYTENFYAMGFVNGKHVCMHRYLIGAQDGQQVDHIDDDGLNNKRDNLRLCNQSQNQANKRKQKTETTSRYKGVSLNRTKGKWRAVVVNNGKWHHAGWHYDEDAAALAYNEKAVEIFGSFARLNVIESEGE